MNGGEKEIIGCLKCRELQARRHRLLQVFVDLVDRRVDLRSIGARSLVDHEYNTRLTIHAGREAVVQRTQLHVRHIAQVQHIAAGTAQHDVVELID